MTATNVWGQENADAYYMLEEINDYPVKSVKSPKYEYLIVSVAIYVNTSGDYDLRGELEMGGIYIGMATNRTYLNDGKQRIDLYFSNKDIYSSRQSGQYTVKLSLMTPNFPLESIDAIYKTKNFYTYDDFNPNYVPPSIPRYIVKYSEEHDTLFLENNVLSVKMDKKKAEISYYYTTDEGKNALYTISLMSIIGYKDNGNMFYEKGEGVFHGTFENATWYTKSVKNGTDPMFGDYFKYILCYQLGIHSISTGMHVADASVNITFMISSYERSSALDFMDIPGGVAIEMNIEISLSTGGLAVSGMVLEISVEDKTRNHEFLLRDEMGDLRFTEKDVRDVEYKFRPRMNERYPKLNFINKWDDRLYSYLSWSDPCGITLGNITKKDGIGVSYVPKGKYMMLYFTYPTGDRFDKTEHVLVMGLHGETPPPEHKPPGIEKERHDPILYLLGSFMAVSIIFLTMRIRSKSYYEEEYELEMIDRKMKRELKKKGGDKDA